MSFNKALGSLQNLFHDARRSFDRKIDPAQTVKRHPNSLAEDGIHGLYCRPEVRVFRVPI